MASYILLGLQGKLEKGSEMRADMSGMIAMFFIALVLVAIFFVVRGVIRYAKRREADRKELLDLMREQNRRQ